MADFFEILRIPHPPRVSFRYLVLGQFQNQTATSDTSTLPIIPTLVLTLPTLTLILRASPLLPPAQIQIRYILEGGRRESSGGSDGRTVCPTCPRRTTSMIPPNINIY